MTQHDKCGEIINNIDRVLAEPLPSIDQALVEAVTKGRMTVEEAAACWDNYMGLYPPIEHLD